MESLIWAAHEFSWANDVSPLCQAAGKSKAWLLPIRPMKISKLKETQTSILFKPLNILSTHPLSDFPFCTLQGFHDFSVHLLSMVFSASKRMAKNVARIASSTAESLVWLSAMNVERERD